MIGPILSFLIIGFLADHMRSEISSVAWPYSVIKELSALKILLLTVAAGLILVSCSCQSKRKKDNSGLFGILENGKAGFMNKSGKVVINPQFDGAGEFHEGLAE